LGAFPVQQARGVADEGINAFCQRTCRRPNYCYNGRCVPSSLPVPVPRPMVDVPKAQGYPNVLGKCQRTCIKGYCLYEYGPGCT